MKKTAKTKKIPVNDSIKIKVLLQGAPIVNSGYIIEKSSRIVALGIDLKSKYCEVDYEREGINGEIIIGVGTNERSIKLNPYANVNTPTEIKLVDFIGWKLFSCELSRYTLKACLIKK